MDEKLIRKMFNVIMKAQWVECIAKMIKIQ